MTVYTQNGEIITNPVARLTVRLRDGNACHICGKHVVEGLLQGDPQQATLDHLIEHGAGGSNDIENMRLAHRACNEQRGWDFKRTREVGKVSGGNAQSAQSDKLGRIAGLEKWIKILESKS